MDLPGLDEPVGLRTRAATDPDGVRAAIVSGRLVLTPVWKAWGPALADAGVDRAAMTAVLRGYGYELWLWAAGERTWAQFLEGLAGRVQRRVGTSADARAARRTARAGGRRKAAGGTTRSRQASKVAKTREVTKARRARGAGKATKAAKPRPATKAWKAKATKVTRPRVATKARKARATKSKATKSKATKSKATKSKATKATTAGKTARPRKVANKARRR